MILYFKDNFDRIFWKFKCHVVFDLMIKMFKLSDYIQLMKFMVSIKLKKKN